MKQLLNLGSLYNILSSLNFPLIISTSISNSFTLLYDIYIYIYNELLCRHLI